MHIPPCRACGVLFCYNEEDTLRDNLTYYLQQGIDLAIFDNCSTDSSLRIIAEFQAFAAKFPGKILEVVSIQTQGYEWQKILRTACDYMHRKLNTYDWVLIIDVDSIYCSPVADMPLLEFLSVVKQYGYNVVNGIMYEFYPTEKDDPAIASVVARMRYCARKEEGLFAALKYHRFVQYHPSIDFYTGFGHIVRRDNRRVLNKVKFIYKHYPWVSYEHGVKKIFKERKPRYVERKFKSTWHWHWLAMLPIPKDLVKRSCDLMLFDNDKVLISRKKFFLIMRLGFISEARGLLTLWGSCLSPGKIGRSAGFVFGAAWKALGYMANMFPYGSLRHSLRLLVRQVKNEIVSFTGSRKARGAAAAPGEARASLLDTLKVKLLAYYSIIFQEPVAFGYPVVYHFLMTNYCNAACVFCNQQAAQGQAKEVSFSDFVRMCANIPVESAKSFVFSGGGDPLLCKDLFMIIRYCNQAFPWIEVHIRTNGLLIGKYARELSELAITRLEISVHGPEQTNDEIIQNKRTGEIFAGIAVLDGYLKEKGKNIYKVFCPALSRRNIESLSALVQKASELGVQEVNAFFCRFYPGFEKAKGAALTREDSLYYHKELYNAAIMKAKRLAARLHVHFEHEPLFFEKFTPKPCRLPWMILVVDERGNCFPCTGGEAWFKDRVRSGEYHFGNLLTEQLYQFWNNDTYVMIRRTLCARHREDFIPECTHCPSTICLKGPDAQEGHLL